MSFEVLSTWMFWVKADLLPLCPYAWPQDPMPNQLAVMQVGSRELQVQDEVGHKEERKKGEGAERGRKVS